jgi:hypothetical protein
MSNLRGNAIGVYRKYDVTRTDGSSAPGGKHADCAYFVLDLEHDEFAIPALKAYATACRKSHHLLAADIAAIIASTQRGCSCREAFCPHTGIGPEGPSETAHELMRDAEKVEK